MFIKRLKPVGNTNVAAGCAVSLRLRVLVVRSVRIVTAKDFLTANGSNRANGPGLPRRTVLSRLTRLLVKFDRKSSVRKALAISSLQMMRLNKGRFCPKNGGFLQKNRGPTEIILHFFLRFYTFWGFFPLQAIAFQPEAPFQSLQKKSCQKHYRRFFVHSALCLNGIVKVVTTGRNEGCQEWTAVMRQTTSRAKRLGARNDRSAFGHPAGKRRCCAPTPRPVGLSGANQSQSKLIKPNQTQLHMLCDPTRAAPPLNSASWAVRAANRGTLSYAVLSIKNAHFRPDFSFSVSSVCSCSSSLVAACRAVLSPRGLSGLSSILAGKGGKGLPKTGVKLPLATNH
jgi:hypothetical protein